VIDFSSYVFPVVRVSRRLFHLSNDRPLFGQFCIEGKKVLLILWEILFSVYRIHGALRLAQAAVNALLRIDYQKVWTFVEAIDGTDLDTICEFASDARIADNISHVISPRKIRAGRSVGF
jgi:hypothetical protein